MKSSFRLLLIAILLQTAFQAKAQQPTEDIILKAMEDELSRNMKELILPKFDKPFFIMYSIQDQKSYSLSATLGSLTQSSATHQRFKSNVRVLVGDYSFNDESLEDNLFSPPTATEISLPLENDYWGIRRSLWSTTDKVYRDAARHFAKHQETLNETGKLLKDIPHRSFAMSPGVKVTSSLTPYSFDKSAWETRLRDLSALYLNHPSIQNSAVYVQYTEGYNYIVSSEGTIAKVPFTLASILAVCQSKNAEGEFSVEQIEHKAKSPDQLPNDQQMAIEIKDMIEKMERESKAPKLDEEYTGPVLLAGPMVAEAFSFALFGGRESLVASDNIAKLKGFQFDAEATSMENKIGKNIINESVSIKLRPKLKTYSDVDLLGSFEIDDEGIVPPDELVLVEKGILKNLMNNRTITNPSQVANGFSSGPGVIEVTVTYKNSEKELKTKLIEQAKKEGLNYALILRQAPSFGLGLVTAYKVSLSDGKEELVRNVLLNPMNLRTFKRIMGASGNYKSYNLDGRNDRGVSIGLTSFIVPDAILFEELEMRPFRMPSLKEEEYVESPLKKL